MRRVHPGAAHETRKTGLERLTEHTAMETMHLIGADDVRSAGNTMRHAAEEMNRAANTLSEALNTHSHDMRELVERLEELFKGAPWKS